MSSPIAKSKKSFFDKLLISFHRKTSHNSRIEILSDLIFKDLRFLMEKENLESIKCLDIGCGDLTLSESISEKDSAISFTGIDIHEVPEALKDVGKWKNYVHFDGKNMPFDDNSFDSALFSDVLHHDYENIEILLKEAKRVSKYIVIKDHFEYGFFSRKILQLADIIGNYGYGISIPKRYLSLKSYDKCISECGLTEVKRLTPIHLYDHSPLVKIIFKSKYQFISILK
ncbi:class I SAM-dependent methyltransferase [Allomuricauda sp. R78024]|uniref:class I SAM-dependent methyltransferase n=1 Tax=Allomuricauda sp. R78024 TaxID=3093867 RepID=UPI0037C5B9C4